MIELLLAEPCIECDKCVDVCPTNVLDRTTSGVPVIARQSDCQTCFMCEAYCPADAIYVAPDVAPVGDAALPLPLLGSYRERIGWGGGRAPGALVAVGPELPKGSPPPRLPGTGTRTD
ncbi:4Fe-4S dicluster domain-containing protein [Rhodococcus triatomae]|uniref:NAD-dependent dihydropyrimidine dehydrogenase, PreA subunit n=1 Tax=Rhodococcus triatomae TaxID=300028 RepID=A0A1G8M1E0_9NOCA|nr:4Fe-4S dicluster domain-containing protein [Rhodococcus triatomae]QNG18218.1 4Fe-4S dicluster domain-containing protein [Rhodococcus triatomae]QNG22111.1 4Fe-4S dicluster domain-containing protein [Rhodococcus triatomae]SDI61756.1 NAD-dependent dihydropyrimidine dehydrogenase, PreA subunit [Rhodococcus triatomae]